MERTRLIVNFDSSGDKLLSTENVIACGETFDVHFKDVALAGTVRVALWDGQTLLWRAEGTAQADGDGSTLQGLKAETKELADTFRGGAGFMAAQFTAGAQVGEDEWQDYGVAYVRLYRGADPAKDPEPARPDIYPTEEELNAWLDEFEAKRADAEKQAKASEESAGESAKDATRAEQAATNAQYYASNAAGASTSAAKSYEAAEAARKAADSAAQVARDARENAQLQQQQATAAAGKANGYRQQAENAQRLATRAKESAEAAQQAAEEAQAAAGTSAANAAQSAADARQKADEAAQSAADASAANGAAQSAKGSAETAKQAAETAKADAESAKAQAESAKAQAATSATQAAGSATNAASSATAAQEAAKALEEGLATLDGLDGRVTLLENGKGIYKDPNTGAVSVFTPLFGSDGTIKVIKELPAFEKVAPMEMPDNETCCVVSDGRRFIFAYGDSNNLFFYTAELKRIGALKNVGNVFNGFSFSLSSGGAAMWDDEETGHLMVALQNNGQLRLYDVNKGALLKSVAHPYTDTLDGVYKRDTIYNQASGHLLTRKIDETTNEAGTKLRHVWWRVWDTALNPVIDETTGEQKLIDAGSVFFPAPDGTIGNGRLYIATYVLVMQMAKDKKTLLTSTNGNGWGRSSDVGLWVLDADDNPIQVMEHIPQEDPERPGYPLCEKNSDGTIKREWEDRNCFFPRLITQEVGPAIFLRAYPAEYGLSAGGNRNGFSGLPYLCPMHNYSHTDSFYSCLRDNCFKYVLTHDNKLVNVAFVGAYIAYNSPEAFPYTYSMPIPNSQNYGKFKFPNNATTLNFLLGCGEHTAIMYPLETDKEHRIAVRGTTKYDNANPFTADNTFMTPFCPIEVSNRNPGAAIQSLSVNARVFFGYPAWSTTYAKAFQGVL